MKEFCFKFKDDYLGYKYCIPYCYYRIRFRKIKNKDLYYFVFADKINLKDPYINSICQDLSYNFRVLNDYFKFDWEKYELEDKLKQNFTYNIYKDRTCFPLSECDKIMDWFESIVILNKLIGE